MWEMSQRADELMRRPVSPAAFEEEDVFSIRPRLLAPLPAKEVKSSPFALTDTKAATADPPKPPLLKPLQTDADQDDKATLRQRYLTALGQSSVGRQTQAALEEALRIVRDGVIRCQSTRAVFTQKEAPHLHALATMAKDADFAADCKPYWALSSRLAAMGLEVHLGNSRSAVKEPARPGRCFGLCGRRAAVYETVYDVVLSVLESSRTPLAQQLRQVAQDAAEDTIAAILDRAQKAVLAQAHQGISNGTFTFKESDYPNFGAMSVLVKRMKELGFTAQRGNCIETVFRYRDE
jgi:hypothetical protein